MISSSNLTEFLNQLPSLVKDVLEEYDKPIFENKYFKYREYLTEDTHSETVLFNKSQWERRPYMFCHDVYGEDYQYLHSVIMTLNKIRSVHDFLPDNIKNSLIIKPSLDALNKVSSKS
jgi:hypothetical protein